VDIRDGDEATQDSADIIRERITQLEQAAQVARLEAMQTAARILTRKSAQFSSMPATRTETADVALLQARYQGLQSKIQDLQTKIDWLHAQEHEHKHN
jgi:prefoldin subunit 5